MEVSVPPNQIQGGREYRKGNWTLEETMVLIEAKKMDHQRRMKRLGEGGERSGKPAELRWKWVEDYCWSKGCLRSQNQCNDKWDNLMRDFKKVREYEKRVAERGEEDKSYWRIDRNARKDNNLPSNMVPQIYEALVDVVERKGQSSAGGASTADTAATTASAAYGVGHLQAVVLTPQAQRHHYQAPAGLLPLPPPAFQPSSQPLPTSDSDTREYTDVPPKRRKKRGGSEREETSGGVGGGGEVIGSAISRSASMIAEAIQSGEERQERRHKELLSLQQRRVEIEESKAEINRQGINGLVDAINKLANSVLAFSSKSQSQSQSQSPPKDDT